MGDQAAEKQAPVLRKTKGLGREAVRRELQNRGIQPVGIHGEDASRLQQEFDREFEAEQEIYLAEKASQEEKERHEDEKLRREQEALKHEKEERKLVKKHPALRLFLELAGKSRTGPEIHFSGGPSLARAIARRLPGCSSLVALDLSNGTLGDSGCSAIASALQKPDSFLQRLDLNNNLIGPPGARSLGNALGINQRLLSLSLEDNDLTNNYQELSGVNAIANMMTSNTTLTSLNLTRTVLGVNGLAAINKALQGNDSIVILDLDFNGNVNISDMNDVSEKIDANKALRESILGEQRVQKAKQKRLEEIERAKIQSQLDEDEEKRQADERAKARQQERIRLHEEAKQARQEYLQEAYQRAMQKQAEWEEKELAKKKKKANKKK